MGQMEILLASARSLGISLDTAQQDAFMRYFRLLEKAGETTNLTGAKGWERVREELFIRSLRLLAPPLGSTVSPAGWFQRAADGRDQARSVIDIGSGAGIPGLVLKLAVPDMRLALLDSSSKKCAFLRLAVSDLALSDVTVIEARAEDAARDAAHRETYDLAVSRGVARLAELAELTLPFVRVGGAVISAKGPNVDGEVAESAHAASLLGAAPALTYTVSTPGSSAPDTLVYWLKVDRTPPRYPRRAGMPHKHPLLLPVRADLEAAVPGAPGTR
jgi:16S rRNA (guanine527-N7)-methyltransferase